ncbi:hypothetical protein FB560_4061 [Microbacterium saperdae]|uniref:Uncharacterized protein n=1 Tax=Microbacterium saperdae TaxID=69368 RepID=A0A543BCP9_9MICO|nr:hypothetical protein FB560_4061 [Microbacterium saperdae]
MLASIRGVCQRPKWGTGGPTARIAEVGGERLPAHLRNQSPFTLTSWRNVCRMVTRLAASAITWSIGL